LITQLSQVRGRCKSFLVFSFSPNNRFLFAVLFEIGLHVASLEEHKPTRLVAGNIPCSASLLIPRGGGSIFSRQFLSLLPRFLTAGTVAIQRLGNLVGDNGANRIQDLLEGVFYRLAHSQSKSISLHFSSAHAFMRHLRSFGGANCAQTSTKICIMFCSTLSHREIRATRH